MNVAQKVLTVGASSEIAKHILRRLAVSGSCLCLAARDAGRLSALADDLRARGAAAVETIQLDLTNADALEGVVAEASSALGGLDSVIVAAGLLPDQEQVEQDARLLRMTMEVNAVGAMALLNEAAALLERQGRGRLVAMGSVAGDRGRASNAAYGAAKGALEIYLSGLRQRLHKRGVQVLLVKPGFVDTPMTEAFAKGPLWAKPERVAADIVRAMETGRSVIYTPWYWRLIMLIVRYIPEPIFVRLRF